MKKLARAAATAAFVLGLGGPGIVAASTGSIDTTGPDSNNSVDINNDANYEATNNNTVSASVGTSQTAHSGEVDVHRNTTSDGDAMSGEAMNENNVSASVSVDNGGNGGWDLGDLGSGDHEGMIENTGPDSDNEITFDNNLDVTVTNNNNINVSNSVNQTATSGDVNVSRNTTAGGASSGDVSNTSTTEFMFEISN